MVMATGAEEGVTEEERKEMGEEAGGEVGEEMGGGEEEEVVGRIEVVGGRTEGEAERIGEVGGRRGREGRDLVGGGEAANNHAALLLTFPPIPHVHPCLCEVVKF